MGVKPAGRTRERKQLKPLDVGDSDILSMVLKSIEEAQLLSDLTKNDQKEYIGCLAKLDMAYESLVTTFGNSSNEVRLRTIVAYMIYHAHKIGTYKTPLSSNKEKDIISVMLRPRTKRPTAEYVDILEMLEPDFGKARQIIKAQKMRVAKNERRASPEEALITVIKEIRGNETSSHPYAEAGRIIVQVNKKLKGDGWSEVKKDVIYRRLKKIRDL